MFTGLSFLATLLAVLPAAVQTQNVSTTVTCQASYNWASNSLKQSPCLVAAYLQQSCIGYGAVYPLLKDHFYGPSTVPYPCQCSTVMYSVYSACGDCQGGLYPSWSGWKVNCTSAYESSYPNTIPSGTAVPGWAFLDVTIKDTYDPIAAKAAVNLDEVTGNGGSPVVASSSTANRASSSTATRSSTASPTALPVPSKKSNVGAIAGGVIGGLVLLGLIAAALLWFLRRRRTSTHVTPVGYHAANTGPVMESATSYYQTAPMTQTAGDQQQLYPSTPKYYDPNDASTYPGSPVPSDMNTMPTMNYSQNTNHNGAIGRYSGAPEL